MLKQPYQDIKLSPYSVKDVKLGSRVSSAIGTAKAFWLAHFILVIDDLKYVLTERFSQHPPENYFSEQGAIAARKNNWAFVTSD